ncbi:MAG TPA: FAD-dependent oxidoreductase [Sulfuricella sp.]|nr:FAD-dependent oxidoreductase [Sulfuricella sp.]
MTKYDYVIVGGGLAGASAIQGIRERNPGGSILLISGEARLPYDRPPLSKKLWFGSMKVEEIYLHDQAYYDSNAVVLSLGARVVKLDPQAKTLADANGRQYRFGKLLLATGGAPRKLPIPGGDLDGICYYRSLDDYLQIRSEATTGKSALIVGGGFIGSELAAALNINQIDVTMIFPDSYLCSRVFPDYLGQAVQRHYQKRGINVLAGDKPVSFSRDGARFVTVTVTGKTIVSDLLIVGVGIAPATELAQQAGLEVGNGIVVNEYLETSSPDVYAAGDNAFFPYPALGQSMRIEHWDNAMIQGQWAGRNMAGAREPFTYQPYFFSDLFEFGYEATGEVDSRLETFADWQEENRTGVIYYLREGRVRGVMMCNVWEKIEAARALIRKGEIVTPESLRGTIR